MIDDGRTIAVPFCDECHALPDWPRKNLITGCCPRCGRESRKAWRLAAALRLVERIERIERV